MCYFPSLYSRSQGQQLNIFVGVILITGIFLMGSCTMVFIYADQFIWCKHGSFECANVPAYANINDAGIMAQVYIFEWNWFNVFFSKTMLYGYGALFVVLALVAVRRPTARVTSLIVLLGLTCAQWWYSLYFGTSYLFSCSGTALCRTWDAPYSSSVKNPIFGWYCIWLLATSLWASILWLELFTLQWLANAQVAAENLEKCTAVGGKRKKNKSVPRKYDREPSKDRKVFQSLTKDRAMLNEEKTESSGTDSDETLSEKRKFRLSDDGLREQHVDNLIFFGHPPPPPQYPRFLGVL